jgi:signal transduction histidine kinase
MSTPGDLLLAGVLLLITEFEIWISPIFQTGLPGPEAALGALALVAIAPLAVRRRLPLAALTCSAAGMLAIGVVGAAEQSAFPLLLALLIAVYSVAAHASAPRALFGGALVLVVGGVYSALTWVEGDSPVDVLVPYLFIVAAWIVGREVWRQRAASAMADERSRLMAQVRQRDMEMAVSEERTRIARELHDVVAHGISVMGVQAAAARATLSADQNQAREALLAVERLGRESLAEMHHMLGVLRGEADAATLEPAPNLGRLTELVDSARRGGLAVELVVDGHPGRAPAGLALSAYRIVQESLTNARKHGASAARVDLRHRPGFLDIAVRDDGPGPPAELRPGHGLLGMQERAALHGGELRFGAHPDGGFLVQATLPVGGPQ